MIRRDASYGAGGHLYGTEVMHIAILPFFNESIFSLNFGTCSASYRLEPPFSKNFLLLQDTNLCISFGLVHIEIDSKVCVPDIPVTSKVPLFSLHHHYDLLHSRKEIFDMNIT